MEPTLIHPGPTHTWKTPLHTRGDRSYTRTIPVRVLRHADTPGFYVVEGEGKTFVIAANELEKR